MMVEFQSRDKRSLNNYYAIEIKSRGFYAVFMRILEFPKQFIVNATGNRQIAQKKFLKIRGRKRIKPV